MKTEIMKNLKEDCNHDYRGTVEHKHSNKDFFIRKYVCGLCGKKEYSVLTIDDGEFVGRVSDGSDCTFGTLAEAKNY